MQNPHRTGAKEAFASKKQRSKCQILTVPLLQGRKPKAHGYFDQLNERVSLILQTLFLETGKDGLLRPEPAEHVQWLTRPDKVGLPNVLPSRIYWGSGLVTIGEHRGEIRRTPTNCRKEFSSHRSQTELSRRSIHLKVGSGKDSVWRIRGSTELK